MALWIKSHQTLRDHPKTRKAARLLRVSRPLMIGHLHCLWWWALDFAPDGDLSKYDLDDIAIAAEWEGDADEFVGALLKVGFLDGTPEKPFLHDWQDYGGYVISKRAADAERKRRQRERERAGSSSEALDDMPTVGHADVTRTSQGNPPLDKNRGDQTRGVEISGEEMSGDEWSEAAVSNHATSSKSSTDPEVARLFDEFVASYPSHRTPPPKVEEARNAWIEIDPDVTVARQIVASVKRWSACNDWKKDDRKWVPNPAKFLEERKWEQPVPADKPRFAPGVDPVIASAVPRELGPRW